MIQMGNIISIDDLIESKRIKEETYQKCIEKLELSDRQIKPFHEAFYSTFKGCLIKKKKNN